MYVRMYLPMYAEHVFRSSIHLSFQPHYVSSLIHILPHQAEPQTPSSDNEARRLLHRHGLPLLVKSPRPVTLQSVTASHRLTNQLSTNRAGLSAAEYILVDFLRVAVGASPLFHSVKTPTSCGLTASIALVNESRINGLNGHGITWYPVLKSGPLVSQLSSCLGPVKAPPHV